MDVLKAGDLEAHLSNVLLRVLDELGRRLGDRGEALREIRKVVADTAAEAVRERVEEVLEDLGVSLDDLKERFDKYAAVADLLLKPLADAKNQGPVELPFETGGSTDVAGSQLAVEGSAELKATLEADFDGQALGERIEFEADEALLRYAVQGRLAGKLSHSSNLGSGSVGLGAEGGGSVLLENYFRHSQQEEVLDALSSDFAAFRLPGAVDEPVDLRGRVQVDTNGAKICIPDQWVHVELEGSLNLQGNLSFSQGTVQTARVRSKTLELDDTLSVATGFQVAGNFSQKLEGGFDVLVSRAEQEGQVRVEVGKNSASERRLGLEVGASVEVEGLDRLAKTVLDRFLPKINAVVDRAEQEVGKLPNLKSLFSARLDEEVGDLLENNQGVVDDLQKLLTALGTDVDLKDKLQELAREAALDVVGDDLEKIDREIDELKKLVLSLVEKYRSVLDKLNQILQKAARVKVGIALSHRRQKNRARKAFLVFRIDPETQPRLLRKLFLGRLQEALDAHRNGEPGVVLEDGVLTESGSLQVSTGFHFTAAGLEHDHASILRQEWTSEVSPTTGDVTLGVKTELEGKTSTFFGRARTLSFLTDTEVVATIGQATALQSPRVTRKATLTLIESLEKAKPKNVRGLQERWVEAGALPVGTELETRLLAATGETKLSGPLTGSALVDLDEAALGRLAATPESTARNVFARTMIGTVSKGQLAAQPDGVPLLLSPGVQEFFERVEREGVSLLKSETFKPVPGWDLSLTRLLWLRRRYLQAFVDTLAELGDLRGSLVGLERRAALEAIRKRQLDLMKHAKVLVTGELGGDGGLGYAFFEAVATLASPGGTADVFTVFDYGGQQVVFG